MSVYHVHVFCSQRPEEDFRPVGTGDTDCNELKCGFWEANLDPLKEHSVLLTSESSLSEKTKITGAVKMAK